ncbi:hypothetical protein D3C86_901440 [compost metagenome]
MPATNGGAKLHATIENFLAPQEPLQYDISVALLLAFAPRAARRCDSLHRLFASPTHGAERLLPRATHDFHWSMRSNKDANAYHRDCRIFSRLCPLSCTPYFSKSVESEFSLRNVTSNLHKARRLIEHPRDIRVVLVSPGRSVDQFD